MPLDSSVWDAFPDASPSAIAKMAVAAKKAPAASVPTDNGEPLPKNTSAWDAFPDATPENVAKMPPAYGGKAGQVETPSTLGGIGENLAAGASEGGWNALTMLPNAANALTNLGIRGVNAVAGTNIPQFSTDVGGDLSKSLANATGGWSPTEVQPHGEAERIARTVGQVPGQMAGMGLGGAAVEAAAPFAAGIAPGAASVAQGAGQTLKEMPLARNFLPTTAGAATGQLAEDVAPEPLKPYASLAGNVVGGLGVGAAQDAVPSAFGAAKNVVGRMGFGTKENLGGVNVTAPQAAAVGQELSNAGGPELTAKLRAQSDAKARVAEIDQQLADPATTPIIAKRLAKEREGLVPQQGEIVPGSKPTLAQAAIGEGGPALPSESLTAINRMEQNARRDAPAAFIARETQQNSARRGAMQGQASETAQPAAVGKMFTDRLDALEGQQAAQVGAAASARGAAGGAPLGGLQRPEDYGAAMHGALTADQIAAKAQATRLYDAVPQDMTANVMPAKEAAAKVLASVGPVEGVATGTELHPAVAKMANVMAQMPDVVPFSALREMRANVGAAAREIAGNPQIGAESRPMRDAMALKGAIDQSIQEAVDRAVLGGGDAGRRIAGELGALDQGSADSLGGAARSFSGTNPNPAGATGAAVSRAGGLGVPPGTSRTAKNGGNARSAPRPVVPLRTVPKEPQRLTAYLKSLGGVRDPGGDVRHMLGGAKELPGLLNKNGVPLDEAALRAWENGYFPHHGEERPTINDLLESLDEDLRGNPVYSAHDVDAADAFNIAREHNQAAERANEEDAQARTQRAKPPLEENITPEGAAAYQKASANYRDYKQTFREGPVGDVLATDRNNARKVHDLAVPAKFFRAGNVDPDAVAAYVKATGGKEPSLALARDYLVSELRDRGIVDRTTGAANRPKLQQWIKERQPALDALGGDLSDRLRTVDKAQEFYDTTVAKHEADIKEFQNGVAKEYLKEDPSLATAKALTGDPTKFTRLAKAVAPNADAREGLKRAVVDWLQERMSSAQAANESENFLKSDQLQKWIAAHKPGLKILFGGQGLQNFEMIAADLRRQAQRATALAGSRTSTDVAAGKMLGGHNGHSIFSFLAGETAGRVAEHFLHIPLSGEAGGALGVVINSLRQHGIDTVAALRREALLHPDLARVLMERVQNGKPGPVLARRLAARLQATLLSNQVQRQEDQQ